MGRGQVVRHRDLYPTKQVLRGPRFGPGIRGESCLVAIRKAIFRCQLIRH
jgi:hypothetical protein